MVRHFPALTDDLLRRLDVPGPRYTSYPTVPEWSEAFGGADHAAKLSEAGQRPATEPLSLYVHVPFCKERCTFCGCNVVVAHDPARADVYLDHLELELDLVAARLGSRRTAGQLHWGGGTPTFLSTTQLTRLWRALGDRFVLAPDAEVSIEIDPAVTTMEQLRVLRGLGFNRLSMGVQDFDPEVQRAVNRIQSVEDTRALVEEARRLGFSSVNFDLIYGLPLQTEASWARTMEQVLALRPDRAAVYSFAFVPEQRPHQKRLATLPIALGRPKLELFRGAYDAFIDAGYQAIGMDHFALATDELAVAQASRDLHRNFMGYTVKRTEDLIGFGVSAISEVQGAYAQNLQALPKYYARLEAGVLATERGIDSTADDRVRRRLIEDLMCNFFAELGPGADENFSGELASLVALERDGLVRRQGSAIELLPLGRIFARNVAMVFDARLARSTRNAFSRTV